MKALALESGVTALAVLFVVALVNWIIGPIFAPKAQFALAVFLFLAAMGIRRAIRWVRKKPTEANAVKNASKH